MAWTVPLLDLLVRSTTPDSPARIVNLSSAGHRFSDLDGSNYGHRPYDQWEAFGPSKTANILFSVELERRLAPLGVHAVAGVYCEDCGVAEVSDDPTARAGVQSYAVDPARAAALWDRSMEMLAAV